MPTVEIIRFPGSDAFLDNPLVLEGALQTLLKADGVMAPYYGIQKEDGRTGYLIIIWESYEHHMKLKKDPAYPEMIKSLGLAVSGPIDVQHVDFDATKALDAPATEISVITLKADTSLEDFHAKSTAVREHLNNEPSCHAMVGGESRENKGTYFSLTGWDNIQSHIDLTAKDEFKEFVKNFLEIADIDVAHSNMVKYPA